MQSFLMDGPIRILRFDPNEEILSTLTEYCTWEKIHAASFEAIGAAKEVTLAWYNLETKKYEEHTLTGMREIVGMIGNVSLKDGKPFVHTYGTFGDRDLSVVGGHIMRATVGITCEMTLTQHQGELKRVFQEEFGLALFG